MSLQVYNAEGSQQLDLKHTREGMQCNSVERSLSAYFRYVVPFELCLAHVKKYGYPCLHDSS
jgi:hypothetical protein